MSFIYGIVNLDGKAVYPEEVTSLAHAVGYPEFIHHSYTYGALGLGYGHHPERRPKAGVLRDKESFILADIRIYNQHQLQESFGFASPLEAFIKAYRKWGPSCADHINGDFAAVVVDQKKKEVLLFRDHIGARPLVYWHFGHRLIFASHEFGLAKSGLVSTRLSERKLVDQYFKQRKLYAETVFQGICKVVPGYYVVCKADGRCESEPFWKPGAIQKNKTLTFDGAVARLRELVVSATLNRMEPGRTGLHVSGGIDSCGLASIVADHASDKKLLTGYSWTPETFKDPVEGVDEKPFVEAFREDKKVNVKYLNLEEYETVKNAILPEFQAQYIEHTVMQMAGKDGIETLFSGWGGDEIISLSLRGTVNHLFFHSKWCTLLKYARAKGIKTTIFQFRTDVLPLLIPFGLLPVYKSDRKDWSILRSLRFAFIRKHWKQIFLHRKKNIFGYGNRTRFVLNLLEDYHLPERMDSWAINAEKYGFEYKYPLLDKEVLEFWFSIPVEYTYKNFHPRLLYREAMKGILTEKIRIRKGKEEALRIANSLKELDNGKAYIKKIFNSLSPEEHLSFFKPKTFRKMFDQPVSKDVLKNVKNWQQYTLYLRYVALVNKYYSVLSVFFIPGKF